MNTNTATAAVTAIVSLHRPHTRYTHDDGPSYDSLAEYADANGTTVAEAQTSVETFQVCVECGRVEMSAPQNPDVNAGDWLYCESIWPCGTELALTKAGVDTDSVRAYIDTATRPSATVTSRTPRPARSCATPPVGWRR